MTLSGEYEKVHYPMPLNYLEDPDIGTLRRTLTRLSSQVNVLSQSNTFSEMVPSNNNPMNQTMDDFALIENENYGLREEIDMMERHFSQTDTGFF